MFYDAAKRDHGLAQDPLKALIVPRPIGWISTISEKGVANVSPYSYFNLMGSDPFYCAFGSTGEKDNVTNLRKIPEFVVNIVSMDLIEIPVLGHQEICQLKNGTRPYPLISGRVPVSP